MVLVSEVDGSGAVKEEDENRAGFTACSVLYIGFWKFEVYNLRYRFQVFATGQIADKHEKS
jgi:hypothetical protein